MQNRILDAHVLCDVPETRARLQPLAVRLYNALGEAHALIRDCLPLAGDRRAQGVYCEAARVLREARRLAEGLQEPPEVLARTITAEFDSIELRAVARQGGRVATALRAIGPNTPMPRYPFEVLDEVTPTEIKR